ncbi:hypothetical protein ACHWQZ_G016642 [Mnemiopsis leidyi]
MVLADDFTIYQDVYCGGPLSTDHSKTYRNNLAMSPLKSFLKVKRTIQLIGNTNLKLAFKQIDNEERVAMTEYQVYEKKQERTMERISRITSNRRLRRLERMITKSPLDEEDSDSKNSQRFVRKRRRKVKAKKRAGVGGTYMKRLKLASDSLKNTDPESSYGTVLNMDSYLAFKDFSGSKVQKRRKSRRRGMVMSKTEQQAIEKKAKETLDKLVPKWRGEKTPKSLTDAEIERKKEELFENIEELHTTLSITELLSQPKGRRGFRPSKVLDRGDTASSFRKCSAGFEPIFTSSRSIPLPTKKKEIPKTLNRRELLESNKLYKLTRESKNRELKIDEEIALLGSFAGLTRFQYLRDDDEKLKEKRLEYNTRLDKLHRRKLGLKRSWINVVNKRRNSLDPRMGLPKNAPMMPLIPNLRKRIIKASKKQAPPKRVGNLFLDILRKIDERNEEGADNEAVYSEDSPPGSGGSAPPAHHRITPSRTTSAKCSSTPLILPALTKTPKTPRTPRTPRKLESVVDFQKAFNLPTKTPSERRIESDAKREQKQKQDLKKKDSKITLPSILAAVKPALMKRNRSNNQLSVPLHSLNSMEQLSLKARDGFESEPSRDVCFAKTEKDVCQFGLDECVESNRRVGTMDNNTSRVSFKEAISTSSTSISSSGSSVTSEDQFDEDYMDKFYKNYDSDDSFQVRAVRKSSCPPTLN